MIELLRSNEVAIRDLCRRYGVARLEVFGSAADSSFDAQRSDIDFLIEFLPGIDLGPWLGRYFDLRDELVQLLGCAVDLVMTSAVRNPYFIREANRTRKLLYAA